MRPEKPSLNKYSDGMLTIEVPIYLRYQPPHPKCQTIDWYFVADRRKSRKSTIESCLLRLIDKSAYDYHLQVIANSFPIQSKDFKYIFIKQGESAWIRNGHESLVRTRIRATGQELLNYSLVYSEAKKYRHLQIDGAGDESEFEYLCRSVVTSLDIDPSGIRKLPKGMSKAANLMKAADVKRLRTALRTLPRELVFLKRAILVIAKEDQDLLGSGEGDASELQRALLSAGGQGEVASKAASTAGILKDWMKRVPNNRANWSQSVWFVIGQLIGAAMYSDSAFRDA